MTQWPCADAGSLCSEAKQTSWPQVILKCQPPICLDYQKFHTAHPEAHPEAHPLTQLLPISKLASHLFFSWSNSLEGPWGPSACGQRQRVREEDQRSHRKDFHFACQQLLRRRWRGPRCMSGELMCRRRNTLSTIESICNCWVWVLSPKGEHVGCLRRPYLWVNV